MMHRWSKIKLNLTLSLFFCVRQVLAGSCWMERAHLCTQRAFTVFFNKACYVASANRNITYVTLWFALQWPTGWWVPICTTIPKSCLSFSLTRRCLPGTLPLLEASQPWRISGRYVKCKIHLFLMKSFIRVTKMFFNCCCIFYHCVT